MMKKSPFYLVLIAVSLLSCQPQQSSNNEDAFTNGPTTPSIVGAWEIVEIAVNAEDTSFVVSPYRSIIIYTDKFYSVEIARQDRPSWPDIPDGKKVSYDNLSNAYSNLISNSGRYEIRGDSIFYELIVAKNPNIMNNPPEGADQFTLDGDKLTTYSKRPSVSFTYTYRRLQ